jgi:hypothetical protein
MLPDAASDAAPSIDAGPQTLSIARSPRMLPNVRDHHTTTVIQSGDKAFLYVIGGTNRWTAIYDDVLRAPIEANGSLGEFVKVATLPEPRAGHAAVVVDGHLVISGGNSMAGTQMQLVTTTIVAPIQSDGSLGAWTPGPKLPVPIMHHTCNADGKTILCIGGRISGNYTSKLAVRTSMQDGVLQPYEAIAPLAKSIGFHEAFVRNHFLYVAGGLHRDPPMADFDRLTAISRLAFEDGTWEDAGTLPAPRYVSSAEIVGDRVYMLGGQAENDDIVDTTLRGAFDADGRVVDLEILPAKLSVPRMHVHQTPSFGGFLYSVGGRDESDDSLGIVDIGAFD